MSKSFSFSIRARRAVGWMLLVVGLGLVVSFVAHESFGVLRIPIVHPYLYGPLGGFLMLLIFLVWRCPQCRCFLGRLDVKFCTNCGLMLTREAPPDPSGRMDPARVRKEFARIRDMLDHLDSIKPRVFLLGFVAGAGVFLLFAGMPDDFTDWLGMIVVGAVAGMILRAGFHSLAIFYYWRCPACGRHLPFQAEGFSIIPGVGADPEVTKCPYCRVSLGETREP